MSYAKHLSGRTTPQTEQVHEKQVPNSAGGFSFKVDDWTRLKRFLVLGSEGGTYYINERKLTQESAASVLKCAALDSRRTVDTIVEVSEKGKAPKNDPAVFALALCASEKNPELNKLAFEAIPKVCRIGTHLFQFVEACNAMRGWGTGFRNAVNDWYANLPPEKLTYQVTKYQSRNVSGSAKKGERNDWTHRDVMRLSHFNKRSHHLPSVYRDVYHWINKGWESVGEEPHPDKALRRIWAHERAKLSTSKKEIVKLITDYDLVRESIPTNFLNEPEVWEALLTNMPLTAMVRSLGKMTSIGLLKPLSKGSKKVVESVSSVEYLKKSRVHPLNLLVALKVYSQGKGDKGSLTWAPDQTIVNALNEAFYLAFDAIEPSGKNWFLGIDVSGSMSAQISGMPLSCCEAATALALVTARTEPYTFLGGFENSFRPFTFSASTRLDTAMKETRNRNFGGTDCSLPMSYAIANGLEVDAFVVLTDSETYAGKMHPHKALEMYRERRGRDAKMIVVGMASNGFTIANPDDAGMLDVVGMSTDVPPLITDFARG